MPIPLSRSVRNLLNSITVVGKGTLQLETSFLFVDDLAGETLESFGSLLRIGLSHKWEGHIDWNGYSDFDSVAFGRSQGIGDAELGFKYFIQPVQGVQPMTALIVHTFTPIGDKFFRTDAFDPSFLVAFSHTLTERSSLGYNIGASLESSNKPSGGKTTLSSLDFSLAYGLSVT